MIYRLSTICHRPGDGKDQGVFLIRKYRSYVKYDSAVANPSHHRRRAHSSPMGQIVLATSAWLSLDHPGGQLLIGQRSAADESDVRLDFDINPSRDRSQSFCQ